MLLQSIGSDVREYREANPDVPHNCYWDFAKMWGWCAAMAGTCNQFLGWACVGMGASCVTSVGDFYFSCM